MADIYFSVDVEADGPIPGQFANSMLSIGVHTPGYRDETGQLHRLAPDAQLNFYRELKPISPNWDPAALAVSGLNRQTLLDGGREPAVAMRELAAEVEAFVLTIPADHGGLNRAVFCAYPLGFDWLFTYWYLQFFTGGSPFGHSGHIDMKTLYLAKAGCSISGATKQRMPRQLLGAGPHTHHALDDAREQGDMLMKLLEWGGPDVPA